MTARTAAARRGSILIVVLGLLALFAVVGLSFVLYADAEATAARAARNARNEDSPPDPAPPANEFLAQLLFGTTGNSSAMLSHDLMSSRFTAGSNVPFYVPAGTDAGVPSEQVAINGTNYDRRRIVNLALASNSAVLSPTLTPGTGNSRQYSKAVPWTYPDVNNFHLAWIDPTTGEVKVPSFHRSDVFGSLDPNNNPLWSDGTGKYLTLRPHPNLHPNFPTVPQNTDGTYTGDVANFKFISGIQKNDSLWMYCGAPVQTYRGRQYAALVAPLIVDLGGRVNLTVAGNMSNGGNHSSTHGWGAYDINPTYVGVTAADLQLLVKARQGTSTSVGGDRNSNTSFGKINVGRTPASTTEARPAMPYAQIDVGGTVGGTDGPPQLPQKSVTTPAFPTYPSGRFESSGTTATVLSNHPSMFNPFQWQRGQNVSGAHGFGVDDLAKLAARYTDPKLRYRSSEVATAATGGSFDTPSTRMLTTPFSVSQFWGVVQVATAASTSTQLGPIDLNRPLPDFRTDLTKPLASSNVVSGAQYAAAMKARTDLARDVFVRLMALAGFVDGTNVSYSPNTGALVFTNAAPAGARQLAQFAANVVDYIDNDDIMTRFAWNNADATAVVYGTELPKLVLSEVYAAMFNDDQDSAPPVVKQMGQPDKYPAQKPAQKKFWVELHNPIMTDTALLPDNGAARLFDPAANIKPYVLGVYENGGSATAYGDYLQGDPAYAASDPAGAGITAKINVDTFSSGNALPALGGAERYLVEPADAAGGVANGNKPYYVVGPTDRAETRMPAAPATTFPDKFEASASFTPAPGGANKLNVMSYDATNGAAPSQGLIQQARAKKHTVVLRRLANPYAALDATNNPYVTVDFVEGITAADRIEFDDQDQRMGVARDDAASQGRRHPYASGALTAGGVTAYKSQTGNGTPGHTFFQANSNLDNTSAGLAWLAHLDRELVNATELLDVSVWSPALLTNKFYNGLLASNGNPRNAGSPVDADFYNRHNRTSGTYGNLLNSSWPAGGSGNLYKAFDLLAVASRMPQIPLGGREPGRVNLNGVASSSVASAVFDPQNGNTFNSTFASNAWNTLATARTPSGTPTGLSDAPIQPFASSATGGSGATLLRNYGLFNTAPSNSSAASPSTGSTAQVHPYFAVEPLRKMLNNVGTVSDGFLVIWTVSFFEVEGTNNAGPVFGKEIYERVPGDLRAQYVAVVDRSTATAQVATTSGVAASAPPFVKPWETKLAEGADSGSTTIQMQGVLAGGSLAIYNGDGSATTVAANTKIRLGLGDAASNTGDGEWVTVQSVGTATNGVVTVTLSAGTTYYHGAGSRVSNALIGSPGVQPTLDCGSAANRHLVPLFMRMQP